MDSQTGKIIISCFLIAIVICITCWVVRSVNHQIKKYSIRPIEDEYPA